MARNRYFSELARLNTWLFLGVMALMTFLLTVGLQHPQKPFSAFIYSCLIILPLGLLVYVIGQGMQMMKKQSNWLGAVRALQVLLFVLGLVAVAGFGLVSAHIFFAPAPAPASSQAQPAQPAQ